VFLYSAALLLKSIIYLFELKNFGHLSKKLAKKCAISSFCKAEDDPTISTSHLATMKVVGFGCLEL
jgi:hypothetical protein